MSKIEKKFQEQPIPINAALVWDYDIPDQGEQTPGFRRWYLSRVLMRGSLEDLRTVGLDMIHSYLGELNLSSDIRRFWEWYFNLPEVKKRYEPADRVSDTDPKRDR